jgi:quercetin dioxygenase-like cupin family protein
MTKILSLAILLSFLINRPAFAYDSKTLLHTNSSWDSQITTFNGQPLDTLSVLITIKPGEALPVHCHPVPSFAYVISGELEVEKKDGSKKIFKEGYVLTEVINTWHRGINKSKTEPVEIVVFYIGAKDKNAVTILENEENKDKCSD